jgi:hypothetical protein
MSLRYCRCQPGRSFGRATGSLGLAENAGLGKGRSGPCQQNPEPSIATSAAVAIKGQEIVDMAITHKCTITHERTAFRFQSPTLAAPIGTWLPVLSTSASHHDARCSHSGARPSHNAGQRVWRFAAVVIEPCVGDGGLVALLARMAGRFEKRWSRPAMG